MILEGQILKDKYKIIRKLGQGGMAQVWLAEEIKMGNRQVAIKAPLPGISDQENQILQARFQREIKVSAELVKAETPNVVKALTVELFEDGDLLVMEYMPGGDLSQKITEHPNGLPIDEVLKISTEILTALDAIHNHPLTITHRDIKPSNILYNSKGQACLGDFGLAQMARVSGALSQTISDNTLIFTPAYRAPELSQPGSYANNTADIYSFGCVFWEMLTGKLYRDHCPDTSPSDIQPSIPVWLDNIVMHCLNEDQWDRWNSPKEIISLIQERSEKNDFSIIHQNKHRNSDSSQFMTSETPRKANSDNKDILSNKKSSKNNSRKIIPKRSIEKHFIEFQHRLSSFFKKTNKTTRIKKQGEYLEKKVVNINKILFLGFSIIVPNAIPLIFVFSKFIIKNEFFHEVIFGKNWTISLLLLWLLIYGLSLLFRKRIFREFDLLNSTFSIIGLIWVVVLLIDYFISGGAILDYLSPIGINEFDYSTTVSLPFLFLLYYLSLELPIESDNYFLFFIPMLYLILFLISADFVKFWTETSRLPTIIELFNLFIESFH